MNLDTIFPVVSAKETIIGRFRWYDCYTRTEVVSTLTNIRLLISWQQTVCCFRKSRYSSITLSSIVRVDESRSSRFGFIAGCILLLISIATAIVGFIVFKEENTRYIVGGIGIGGIAVSLFLCIVYYIALTATYITLIGTFGTLVLTLTKMDARRFEAQINESIYRSSRKVSNKTRNVKVRKIRGIYSIFNENERSPDADTNSQHRRIDDV